MLFNTKEFAIFYGIVLALYWLVWKWRNVRSFMLLAANGYFYFHFHYRLPVYLFILISISYCSALALSRLDHERQRKTLLIVTIAILGLGLFYIKYSGLILGSIPGLDQWQASALHIIIPIGISYFTFSSIGYVTDVYRRKTIAETNFIIYASYISYFPHILCGPIPSSAIILHQFRHPVKPSMQVIELSCSEILWGLFKKMVVADNLIITVNYCFEHYADLSGSTLFLGVALFSFFIYADFSGYSDIARGTSRLLGIELARNFQMPLFSRNPSELWRRWHTSLRKWILDYIYLPLGGNRGSKLHYILLMFFIFGFSGLWHGANITFVCWGILNGMYFLVYILTDNLVHYKQPPSPGRIFPTLKEFSKILFTFFLATIMRIFFRSPDIYVAKAIFTKVFSSSLFAIPVTLVTEKFVWCIPMIVVEWVQREKGYVLEMFKYNPIIRIAIYFAVISAIYLLCRKQSTTECYYFKF